MSRAERLAALTMLILISGNRIASAGDMTAEIAFDHAHPHLLQTRFGAYGPAGRKTVFPLADGLRVWLPPGVAGVNHSGVYSKFALAGDCEVTLKYEMPLIKPSQTGCTVGLAFDIDEGGGSGEIQWVNGTGNASGFLLRAVRREKHGGENRLVVGGGSRGRIGLRRINSELIFLAGDGPEGELQELDRLPFPDRTVRTMRLFGSPAGSASGVDVRIREIRIRAEEITGGVTEKVANAWNWWWFLVLVPILGFVLFWVWRRHLRTSRGAAAAL
jgi:hypothetical protein